jgi:predicted RNase H-like HicB family nuclease
MEKNLEYYLNLNWTLVEGEDLDFDGNPYSYIEIKEIPSFTFCAKTIEKARENYKNQLKLILMVMLEDEEEIKEPEKNNNITYNNILL